MMSRDIVLWDLDNCLSDDSWRLRFIDWHEDNPGERYAKYHALILGDEPGNLDVWERWLALNTEPVFVTGRPDTARYSTLHWIASHLGIQRPRLLMRNRNDHRPGERVKRDLLLNEPDLRTPRVVAAYDDHPPIVEMYRRDFGISSHLLSIHSRRAYTAPPLSSKDKQ